ncbi:kinase-like protein [Stipitochalara longipes BDJ]|nr:kinase-like protein [Stipitochalara longipes BDJ]
MSTSTMFPRSTSGSLKLQTDPRPSNSSNPPSPKSRPVSLRRPIAEEEVEEEEEETSSEAAEPVTPTDSHQSHTLHMNGKASSENVHTLEPIFSKPPLIVNTAATPPSSPGRDMKPRPQQTPKTPSTQVQKRPTASIVVSKDGAIKRGFSGLFKRSNSQSANLNVQPMGQVNGSDSMLGKEQRRTPIRRMSATVSAYTTRSNTIRSNTPPSPGSPTVDSEQQSIEKSPDTDGFLDHSRRKTRSSTGFSLRDKISNTKTKIAFAPADKESKHGNRRHRTTSVDLESHIPDPSDDPRVKLPTRQIWGMAADTGTGLKSRRMSLNLPDDFTVDVVELYSEYTDQSKIIGRRGKHVGKGATSNVRLMHRKGHPGEVYAVKEFRGKSTNEKSEDYEQKVKSEYSIAKSVHHPNIVETFRLCTHNGRWNHVMEFCDQGDLFSLVTQKYLSKEDHLKDRLCLFKQLVHGLNYLHNNGIAHRDIKLENLLITKDSKLKITDFGVSEVFAGIHPGLRAAGGQCGREMGEIRLCAPGMCGSPPYVAPEVIAKTGEYDPRPLDVWGAAIVMLTMTAGGNIWQEAIPGNSPVYDDLVKGWAKWYAKHPGQESPEIKETDYPHVAFFDSMINPPALRRILLTMLNPDPSKRITIASVAKNRWFRNIECCQVETYDDLPVTIDASKSRNSTKPLGKTYNHNHLPPQLHLGHRLVRLPGSTDM